MSDPQPHAERPTHGGQLVPRPKLLILQFKYLGDLVLATPALRTVRAALPEWDLHVLVPEEAVPLLARVPWLDQVWGFPRIRGQLNLGPSSRVLGRLRRERFAVSADLAGNDRGAVLSLLIGAKRRIGVVAPGGFFLRSRCYTDRVEAFDLAQHESIRSWGVLSPLGVPFPANMRPEIAADPSLANAAHELLGGAQVLCYVTASQPKREWPLESWLAFADKARSLGRTIALTGGSSPREKQVLRAIADRNAGVAILPAPEPLEMLLAVLAQARLLVTADTGPMHFAAALGVPTLSLFGPTAPARWAPLGERHRCIQGDLCPCSGHSTVCSAARPCMSAITPERVYEAYVKFAQESPRSAQAEEGRSGNGVSLTVVGGAQRFS